MLTKSDKNWIQNNSASKNELNDAISGLRQDSIKFKDEILSEIRGLREEVLVVTGYKEAIENHEERITTLEEKAGVSS